MPIYEFKCPVCGKKEEAFRSIEARDVRPWCKPCEKPMDRLTSQVAPAHFKGTGFYETDYKRK